MIAGTPMKIRGFLAFVTFGVILLVSARIYPQVSGATFTGSVSDASGAVIPDAQISIKNVATAVTRNLAAARGHWVTSALKFDLGGAHDF